MNNRSTQPSGELVWQLPLTMAGLARQASGPLVAAVLLAMLSAAFSILPGWLIYRMVLALPTADLGTIWLLSGAIGVALILRWAMMAVAHVQAHRAAFRIQYRLKTAMARHLGEVPLSFFSHRGSGGLRRTLSDDVNSLEGFFAHMLPDAVASATIPLASTALLLYVDWRLALASLIPVPLALLSQWWFMRGSRERMQEWNGLQMRIADQMGEYVRGIHLIRTFNLSARSFGKLSALIHGAVEWVSEYAARAARGWVVFTSLLSAGLMVVAPLGAWLVSNGQITFATLVLFLLLAPSVLAPLLRLTFAFGEQIQRQQAMQRISEVLASPALSVAAAVPLPQQPLTIEFNQVWQSYDGRPGLQNVSFSAHHGQLTAIVGASGAGKSTLLQLVARLREYDSGRLCVGGLAVNDWPLDELLQRIAIVFQDVFLFHGSVRDNLLMARPTASNAELQQAARAARAHDFIMALPQGYDTPLGERGARLSGGERQRLSIARALLKDAPILLLDEATASIDADNEVFIQQALNTLCRNRTVLMIAHRLQTIRHADQIVVLDQGRVAACGNHQQLLQDCPIYQSLWQASQSTRHWTLSSGVRAENQQATTHKETLR